MKKKLLSIGSLVLGVSMLASCSNANNKVKFNENWLLDTTTTAIVGAKETLTYTVKFEAGSNANTEYRSVSYATGVYTTTLQTELSEDGSETLYRYSTRLEIPVTYEHFATSGILSQTDVVTSEVVFRGKEKNLKPISSTKTVVSHSPTTVDDPESLEQCYGYYNYTVNVTYNDDMSGVSTTINHAKTEPTETKVNFEAANEDYSTLDNEQLLLALRGIETLGAQKFNVYNNSWKSSQLVALTTNSSSSDEFTINETKYTIAYTPVTIKLDVVNPGSEQTVWIANTTNLTNNSYRNVILYMELPIYYSYGTFQYSLTSAQYM